MKFKPLERVAFPIWGQHIVSSISFLQLLCLPCQHKGGDRPRTYCRANPLPQLQYQLQHGADSQQVAVHWQTDHQAPGVPRWNYDDGDGGECDDGAGVGDDCDGDDDDGGGRGGDNDDGVGDCDDGDNDGDGGDDDDGGDNDDGDGGDSDDGDDNDRWWWWWWWRWRCGGGDDDDDGGGGDDDDDGGGGDDDDGGGGGDDDDGGGGDDDDGGGGGDDDDGGGGDDDGGGGDDDGGGGDDDDSGAVDDDESSILSPATKFIALGHNNTLHYCMLEGDSCPARNGTWHMKDFEFLLLTSFIWSLLQMTCHQGRPHTLSLFLHIMTWWMLFSLETGTAVGRFSTM